ncbi:MAG: hypothetical protein GEU86_22215 [Actinophytocola sp.]|nr:hypothetical protein [Actinophytocola sp.]
MRILLDADTPIQILPLMRHTLRGHRVDHVHDLGWSRKKDRPLLRDAAQARYQLFLTNDSNQLNDPDECREIKKSRMHHVRYAHRHAGLAGLALAIGAIVAAMPGVVAHLEAANGQLLVRINGLDPTPSRRFDVQDPKTSPPRYWH